MEEHILDENSGKKARRRKKLLYSTIRQQMEFYFSDSNLCKDRFLGQLLQDDSYVDLKVFLNFNKLRSLTTNLDDIRKALQESEILKLSDDNTKVCRITPILEKQNQDDCVIYVERLPVDAEHDWLKDVFSKFGPVDYVSIPKYKHNKIIKGFAFVEFQTAKSANKVIEYFESIGCKLPTRMPPDQLMSIVTFENENSTLPNKIAPEENLENDELKPEEVDGQDKIETKEATKEKIKKIKHEDISQEKTDKELKKETPENKKMKKRKLSTTETEQLVKKYKEEHVSETEDSNKVNETEEPTDKSDNNENDMELSSEKRKRKRKKSSKNKTQLDLKQIGLQVLSKREWKQLRNKYLNLQRQKMKSLKEHLYRARFASSVHSSDKIEKKEPGETPKVEEAEVSEPRFKFTPGTIVNFHLNEMCNDIKKFKTDLRSHAGVEFIDIEADCSKNGFIRFASNEDANLFIKEEPLNATLSILAGEEEKAYWAKITKDRELKFKKDVGKKQRGRDKLLRKAEKELGKHIRFENAE